MPQLWYQNYNPLGNTLLSTIAAAVPVCLLCYLMAIRRAAAWRAALAGLAAGVAVALLVFHMPAVMVAGAIANAAVFGTIRVVLTLAAALFAYDLVVESGRLRVVTDSIAGITSDRRLQTLVIAFAFSAVIEGSGGGGAPVAIAAAMLVGLGFKPMEAAMVCLLANTIPVVYGAMGTPIRTLAMVAGLPEPDVSTMTGRLLAPFALLVPFWMAHVQSGFAGIAELWPPLLVGGATFGAIFLFWASYMDISLVAILAGMGTLVVLALFLRVWKPRQPGFAAAAGSAPARHAASEILRAWSPFLLLVAFVILWGLPGIRSLLDATTWKVPVPGLHLMVVRQPPAVAKPQYEPAVFEFAWLAGSGSAAFLGSLLAGPLLGLSFARTLRIFLRSLYRIRAGILAILGMLSLGFLTRYCGMDAVLALALTHTGPLFPIFGTLIGWFGVLLTGTNAGSNALFGSLQVITARALDLPAVLMATANAAGGVMGKIINAQSLVIGCAAAGLGGREGDLFRVLFKHSLALAALIGLVVTVIAYWLPGLVPGGR